MNTIKAIQQLSSKSATNLLMPAFGTFNMHASMVRTLPVCTRGIHIQSYQRQKISTADADTLVTPDELLKPAFPKPIRNEFMSGQLSTVELENLDIGLNKHRQPVTFSDRVALAIVKSLRIPADLFFRKKYLHRAVALETVAAVPGMVGGVIRHLRSLRKMKHDGGWITHLLHEAENERMHLLTWMKVCKPTILERALVAAVQGVFFNCFFLIYLFTPKTAHRIVGYLEEEAVISYTGFLNEVDAGNIENKPAPQIAIDYWNLHKDATVRDVVLAVRADEALHRDTNHNFSDRIKLNKEDLRKDLSGGDLKRVGAIQDQGANWAA